MAATGDRTDSDMGRLITELKNKFIDQQQSGARIANACWRDIKVIIRASGDGRCFRFQRFRCL